MKRSKSLLVGLSNLLSSTKPPLTPPNSSPLLKLRPLSTSTTTTTTNINPTEEKDQLPSKPYDKDSFILESFRLRKLKGTGENKRPAPPPPPPPPPSQSSDESPEVVSSFKELGLREEVIKAVEGMGIFVPSEIQCVGIPAVLDGKSVVLSSGSGSGRTLAYLLPLVQMLRRDEASLSMKRKHPRAIVLCTTEESADQGFRVAKFVSHYSRLKSSMESGGDSPKTLEDVSNAPIGMLVGTPNEILEYVEDGSLLCDDIKYLVLDEADTLVNNEFRPGISKILSQLKHNASKSNNREFQTILVTSTISEMLGERGSSAMECLEHDNAGKVAAMLIEMDQEEIFDLIESPNALKKKVAEAVNSLTLGASGS